MKHLLLAGLMTCGFVMAADPVPPVTFVGHDKVAEALAKGGGIAKGSDLNVSGSHRTAAGKVEVHDKETDIMYVTEGTATLVTGGTMVGGAVSKPGQWLGSDIRGGDTRYLVKGDVVVVPAGTPPLVQRSAGLRSQLLRGEGPETVAAVLGGGGGGMPGTAAV